MAGIIAVYSLVISVLLAGDLGPDQNYSLFQFVFTEDLAQYANRYLTLRTIGVSCTLQQVSQSALRDLQQDMPLGLSETWWVSPKSPGANR